MIDYITCQGISEEDWLEELGFVIECEIPLEIYHLESQFLVTGTAAKNLIDIERKHYNKLAEINPKCHDCNKVALYVRHIKNLSSVYFCKKHALQEPKFNVDTEEIMWEELDG